MSTPVRTRFAPSPTGFLHVGGVRTALFAWLLARQANGQFILRLEDTDKVREVSGSDQHIMDSLRWLGLMWDEGPDNGGPHGPYRQSQRLSIYKEWARKLVEQGRAYADPTTPKQLEALRQQAVAAKRPFLFRDHRPVQPPAWDGQQPLRFKSEPKDYHWHDEVMGDLSTGPEVVDDFILMKSDGYPTYNFAHIIDDHLMEITHVIRSQEFLSSMPKFLNLYEALGLTWPKFATLPYVMGPDGKKKLSKRDGAKDILEYAREGYLPEALINFLAGLGWNDGTDQEIFSVPELIQKFSLTRVQKSGARFDEQRLVWMNGHYIRELTLDDLFTKAADFWPSQAAAADEDYKKSVLALVQERLKFLAELPVLTTFFFTEPAVQAEQLTAQKLDGPTAKTFLTTVVETLTDSDFSEADLEQRLRGLVERLATKPGILFHLIRVAVTGSEVAPGLFETLHVLGKPTSLGRLQKAVSVL